MFSRIILLLSLVCTVFYATAAAQVQAPGPGREIRVALARYLREWSPGMLSANYELVFNTEAQGRWYDTTLKGADTLRFGVDQRLRVDSLKPVDHPREESEAIAAALGGRIAEEKDLPVCRVTVATQPCVWSPQGVASFKFGEPRVQDSTAIISFAVSIVTEYDSRAAAAGRGTGRVVRPANRAYAAFMSKTAAGWRVVSLVLVSA